MFKLMCLNVTLYAKGVAGMQKKVSCVKNNMSHATLYAKE